MFLKFHGILQLQKKHSKLLEKYANLSEMKKNFRECATLLQLKYNEVEKDKESLEKGDF